ncbi:MAG: efflux RND transporter periplasmic adaptor subunit [Vicinamibacterales bacterium]
MTRTPAALLLLFLAALGTAACGGSEATAAPPDEAGAASVRLAPVSQEPIQRFINVSGTLVARERAEVAAEIAGRVIATPIERGSRVAAGAELVRISSVEVLAQADEAEANVAQIEARLGMASDEGFDVEHVPEVANARAADQLAKTELARARLLRDQQLLAASDYDQRAAQAEAAARQYDTARNGALQQFQSLVAARARASLARKAVQDAVVRAPFPGMVAERLVSAGDYVTKGTKVAAVIRVDPLRVELTVPAQFVAEVATGRAVTMSMDAFPGETFTGAVSTSRRRSTRIRARSSSRRSWPTPTGGSSPACSPPPASSRRRVCRRCWCRPPPSARSRARRGSSSPPARPTPGAWTNASSPPARSWATASRSPRARKPASRWSWRGSTRWSTAPASPSGRRRCSGWPRSAFAAPSSRGCWFCR